MTQIVHLADIHIGHSNSSRTAEYKDVFDKIEVPARAIVVIAGDVFDYKIKFSGEDVALFNYMLSKLTENGNEVIIIPGNHDTALQNLQSVDLISPLAQQEEPMVPIGEEYWAAPTYVSSRPHIHYWQRSGIYTLGGLTFLHISVKCGLQTRDILPLVGGKILLYHGGVEGIKFADKKVITREIMHTSELTLLGDIHDHEDFGTNAAYPGSLIQLHYGEKLTKGYLLWTKTDAGWRYQFKQIIGPRQYVTIDVKNSTREETIAQLNAISVRTENKVRIKAGAEPLDAEIIEVVNAKFPGAINIECEPKFDPLTEAAARENIRAALGAAGVGDTDIQNTIEDFLTRGVEQRTTRWYPVRMQWSNYFNYGPDNVLEFRPGVISGLTAPNCAGKSSIIDILTLGLFNGLLRGNKKQSVRDYCSSARVVIEFVAGNEEYKIVRFSRANGGSTAKLFKGDVDISGVSKKATYATVAGLIGTLQTFERTCLFYGMKNDLLFETSIMRLKFMSALFGLRDDGAVCEPLTKALAENAAEMKALVVPAINAAHSTESERLELESMEQRAKELSCRLMVIDAEVNNLTNSITNLTENEINDELASIPDYEHRDIFELLSEYNKWAPYARKSPAAPIIATPIELSNIANKLASMPVLQTANLPEVDSAADMSLDEAITVKKVQPAPYCEHPGVAPEPAQSIVAFATMNLPDEVVPMKGDLILLFANVAKLPRGKPGNGAPVLPKGTLALPVEPKRICTRPNRTLNEIIAELENYNSAIDVSLSIKALDEEYNRILAGTNFKFEANCKCCAHNSTYIDSRINDIMEQRPKLIAKQNNYKLSVELKKELENAQNYAHNEEMIAREAHNAKVEETNRYYDNCDYIEYKNALDKFYAALMYESNQNKIVKSYNAKLAAYEAYDAWHIYSRAVATIKKYSFERMALEARFASMCSYAYNIADALQKEINAAQVAEKYIARKKYLRDSLPTAIASDSAKNRLRIISADRSCLLDELIAINNQISNTERMIDDHENENLILENYKRRMPQLTTDKKRITSYLKLITGGKIRQAVIGAHLQQLIKHVNTFLRDIAPFSLSYTIKTGLDININEPGKMERDVTSGSGFQKHIISLAFRMTLTKLYPHAGQFMLIDEGFNTFDPNNISLAAQILKANSNSYMAIILVTHNPDLKAILDHDIRINIDNGVSKVVDFVTPFNVEPFQEILDEAKPTDQITQEKGKRAIGTYVCVCGKSMQNVPSTIKNHATSKAHRDYVTSHPQNQPAAN